MADKETAQEAQPDEAKASAVVDGEDVTQAATEAVVETVADAGEGEPAVLLQGDLDKAQAALAEAQNQLLRARAEAQNVRRRAEQDVEKAHKYALEKFAAELLPVVDSLERTIDSASPEGSGVSIIREGVEMTLNLLMAALKKFNVEPVSPEGEPFDPQLHQAVSMVENADVEPNTVLSVMQKGYQLNGRLVRPAMVLVSKAAPKTMPKIDEQA